MAFKPPNTQSIVSAALKAAGFSVGASYAPDASRADVDVWLSTIHSFKGDEAADVYVLNVSQHGLAARGFSPEENRLFYVAASRASENLYLLCVDELPAVWGGSDV